MSVADALTTLRDVRVARPPRMAVRLARLVSQAVLIGMAVGFVYWAVVAWEMPDAGAYWEAGLRLRAGEPLYPALESVEASEVYRYAPWFAWLAVPFTYLPVAVAGAIWSLILVASSTAAVLPLVRRGELVLAFFFWATLVGISGIGNVQPLMIVMLALGVERRTGPLWIALAASLKAVPILFVLVYLGRRQWGRAAATFGLTALLVAPMLLYDLSHYPASAGEAGLLITWPPVYVVVVAVAGAATLALARTRYGWLSAATAVCLALPRFFVYDVTFMLVGATASTDPTAQRSPRTYTGQPSTVVART